MIIYSYQHTQQKKRLEKLFQQELAAVLEKKEIENVVVNFQLVMDSKGRTKEMAAMTITHNKRLIKFEAFKGKFKKSATSVILEVKDYFNQHSGII